MDLFTKQVSYYSEKIEKARKSTTDARIESQMNASGKNKEQLKAMIDNNDNELSKFAVELAKFLMPGRVSCTSYAGVVSRLMDYVGVNDYTIGVGFCLPKSGKNYEEDKIRWNNEKASGVEHPVTATHAFVLGSNKICYELFNGETSGIDHIDCVDIKTKAKLEVPELI